VARAASFGSFSYPYKKMNKLRGSMPLPQKKEWIPDRVA
jgi:hypothetical protein